MINAYVFLMNMIDLKKDIVIGLGEIGNEGLGEVVKIMNKNKIPIVLETPIDDTRDDFENIRKAKSLA